MEAARAAGCWCVAEPRLEEVTGVGLGLNQGSGGAHSEGQRGVGDGRGALAQQRRSRGGQRQRACWTEQGRRSGAAAEKPAAALEGDGIEIREARVRAPELGLGPKGCGEAGRPGLSLSSLSLILPLTEKK